MKNTIDLVIGEIRAVLETSDFGSERKVVEEIIAAQKIVCLGAGRVGLALEGFAKRLAHLGKQAYWYGDSVLPSTGAGDLLVLGSGSGETESIFVLAKIAKQRGLRIVLITANSVSSMQKLADASIILNCPSKMVRNHPVTSNQPMTTLFEQTCHLYLDALILELMQAMDVSELEMQARHNVIE